MTREKRRVFRLEVEFDAVPRQRGRQRPPARRRDAAPTLAGPFAGVHLDRVGRRLRLVGQLGKREAQLVGTHAFRFLAEEALTEEIQLMAERGVLALHLRQFGLQRGDERPRRGEIVKVARGLVRHARIIREPDRAYNGAARLGHAFVPAPATRLGDIDAGDQERQVAASHFDHGGPVVRPRKGPVLESFVQHAEPRPIPG